MNVGENPTHALDLILDEIIMISIDQKAKVIAKEEKIYLWQIKLDGRFAGRGVNEFSGALPNECAKKIFELINQWIKEGKLR